MPQNLRLSAHEASAVDALRASADAALAHAIDQSSLVSPCGEGIDSPAMRTARALRTDVDVDELLSRGNGVHDKPPTRRSPAATQWPGAPDRLGTMAPIWDVAGLRRNLVDHPNRALVDYVLHELSVGVDLQMVLPPGVTYHQISHLVGTDPIPPARAKVMEHLDVAKRHVQKYIDAGTLVVVPNGTRVLIHQIDLVDKPDADGNVTDFRIVHDMTDKKNKWSVNNMTPRDLWHIERADHAALSYLIRDGMTCAVVKDIKSAFRTEQLLPSQQCLQCFYLDGVCYSSLSMTFGNRAAGFIWDSLAGLVQWILKHRVSQRFGTHNVHVTHIGDDFCVALRYAVHLHEAEAMVDQIMAELGARTGREKNQCGFRFTFKGINVDLFAGTLSVKPQRLVKLTGKFGRAANDITARYTRHELLSLAGNVAFIATHSAAALVFARTLYKAAAFAMSHRCVVALLPEARQDVNAMLYCVTRMSWLTIRPIRIAYFDSDASGSDGAGAAISALWLKFVHFLHFPFPRQFLTHAKLEIAATPATNCHATGDQEALTLLGGQKASSGLLELCAATVAIITFREQLRGATVVLCSDSTAAIHAITGMYSALPRSAQMLKYLAALAMSHDIIIAPVHRPRELLTHVDALTHYDVAKFRSLVPRADTLATSVMPEVLSLLLDPKSIHETADVFRILA
jgi:hypothetical protein